MNKCQKLHLWMILPMIIMQLGIAFRYKALKQPATILGVAVKVVPYFMIPIGKWPITQTILTNLIK
ncbi:MAG: hypothetical protein CMB80_28835 [Flammeovirgaceae bacterium]|nr:hypothetical protein [Flammeovirgaceae bacterium]|tara:strand:- start:2868 stop:3065 length:198 start_codon:yes stop_codon:yes gene_type:complete